MSVTKASQFDLSKITFSDVKVDNNGRKMVFVNYNRGKVLLQTPKMYVPNGLRRWRKKDVTDNKDDAFELELSFGTQETSTDKNSVEIREFHKRLQDFDELVKRNMISHSGEWLGKKKLSMETIEEGDLYIPSVKVAKDKDGNVLEYPSRIKAKLDRERIGESDNFTGRFLSNKRYKTPVMIFDENKHSMDLNEANYDVVVPKGSQAIVLLELVYLNIGTRVSAKWKLVQGQVWASRQTITGFALLTDDDEAQQHSELPDDLHEEHNEVQHVHAEEEEEDNEVQEEHEEEEQEDEEDDLEPTPPPAPVVTKAKPRAKRGVVA